MRAASWILVFAVACAAWALTDLYATLQRHAAVQSHMRALLNADE